MSSLSAAGSGALSAGRPCQAHFGYASGQISYINLAGDTRETHFANVASGVGGLAQAGKFMLAQDSSGAWATHYIFDMAGVLTDSADWNYFSRSYD